MSSIRQAGRAIVWAVTLWGIAITGFGLATLGGANTWAFAVALLCLAVAGAADLVSAVFRGTVLQRQTPDQLRGRVTAIHILVVSGGPRVGDIEAAAVAAVVGPQLSVLSGGVLCLVGIVAVVRGFPELWRHVEDRGTTAAA